MARSVFFFAALVTTLGLASAAFAEPTAADKETARQALADGKRMLAAGDAKGALVRFEAAYALVRVPTTGLALAKAQEATGKLVEARDTALTAATAPTEQNEAFENAAAEARTLAARLEPRIPSLVLKVTPASATPEVTIDDRAVPPAAVTLPLRMNPGSHKLRVKAPGFAAEERAVEVAESAKGNLEVALRALSPEEVAAEQAQAQGSRHVPLWAWISLGRGVALAGVAVGFRVDEASAEANARENCGADLKTCPPLSAGGYDPAPDNARKNRDFPVFVATAIGSGVALGGAAIGILTAPREAPAQGTGSWRATPWISPHVTGGSIEVRF